MQQLPQHIGIIYKQNISGIQWMPRKLTGMCLPWPWNISLPIIIDSQRLSMSGYPYRALICQNHQMQHSAHNANNCTSIHGISSNVWPLPGKHCSISSTETYKSSTKSTILTLTSSNSYGKDGYWSEWIPISTTNLQITQHHSRHCSKDSTELDGNRTIMGGLQFCGLTTLTTPPTRKQAEWYSILASSRSYGNTYSKYGPPKMLHYTHPHHLNLLPLNWNSRWTIFCIFPSKTQQPNIWWKISPVSKLFNKHQHESSNGH